MNNNDVPSSKSIPFRLLEQRKQSNKLAIILPGVAYTTQAPLLHFTTGILFNKGFDVLHLNYSYNGQEFSSLDKKDFAHDVQLVIDQAIKNKQYDHFTLAAKSIGTIALSYLLDHPMFKNAKLVWLTPLLQRSDVCNAMAKSHNDGLCIIGNEDRCFIEERVEELKNKSNLLVKVVEGGNHSLELSDDPIKSIDVLKKLMGYIDEF